MKAAGWPLLIGIMLGLSATGAPVPQRGGLPASLASELARHVAVVVNGPVTFRRAGWNQPVPVRFGTVLRSGDLLALATGTSAVIVCDGFVTAASVTGQGIKPVPCERAARPIPTWKRGPIIPTARIEGPGLGVSAMGMMAKTYEESPSLRWLAVPGVDTYDVSISGPGVTWRDTFSGCAKVSQEHVCSTDVASFVAPPKLHEDAAYVLSITPTRYAGKLLEALTFRQAFMVLNRPSEAVIQNEISSLDKLGVAPIIVKFLAAKILAVSGAHDAAVVMFRALRAQLIEPALDVELAEVYRAKGSDGDAEKLLEGAIAAYVKNGDVIGRALAEETLAGIQVKAPSRLQSGLVHFKNALEIYEKLGDSPETVRVKNLITAIAVVGGGR